jgi:enoyl-CoA hydratase/carnithine racemase
MPLTSLFLILQCVKKTQKVMVLCTGEFLALTGARLNGKELVAAGMATHFVPFEVSLNYTTLYLLISQSWNRYLFQKLFFIFWMRGRLTPKAVEHRIPCLLQDGRFHSSFRKMSRNILVIIE